AASARTGKGGAAVALLPPGGGNSMHDTETTASVTSNSSSSSSSDGSSSSGGGGGRGARGRSAAAAAAADLVDADVSAAGAVGRACLTGLNGGAKAQSAATGQRPSSSSEVAPGSNVGNKSATAAATARLVEAEGLNMFAPSSNRREGASTNGINAAVTETPAFWDVLSRTLGVKGKDTSTTVSGGDGKEPGGFVDGDGGGGGDGGVDAGDRGEGSDGEGVGIPRAVGPSPCPSCAVTQAR
ncbi:unnamed protein product, partial [Scytosiphon promiscuus]